VFNITHLILGTVEREPAPSCRSIELFFASHARFKSVNRQYHHHWHAVGVSCYTVNALKLCELFNANTTRVVSLQHQSANRCKLSPRRDFLHCVSKTTLMLHTMTSTYINRFS